MTSYLSTLGPGITALLLLLVGHVLADFALQSRRMVERKGELVPTLQHAGVVLLAHTALFLPFLGAGTFPILLLVALAHLVIDLAKGTLRDRGLPSLPLFLGDQALHVAVIVGAWLMLPVDLLAHRALIPGAPPTAPLGWVGLSKIVLTLGVFVFNHHGGNVAVRALLPEPTPDSATQDPLEAGRRIGTLERWLVLLLVLLGQWSAIALVLAAKSIARFEELRDKAFAEYYLVGTLGSVLVAVTTGLGLRFLL